MTLWAPFDELHEILGTGAIAVAIGTSLAIGSRPYRLAALVLILEVFGWLGFTWLFDQGDRILFGHFKSLIVAALLSLIVLRHRSAGLVVMLGLQFVAVIFHLSVWLERSIPASINAFVLNAVGWAMLGALWTGSVLSTRAAASRLEVTSS